MASSLLDLLLQAPSASDRFFALLPLIQQATQPTTSSYTSGYSSDQSDVTGRTVPVEGGVRHVPVSVPRGGGEIPAPGPRPEVSMTGETTYPYTVYDKPYGGVPPNLVTRQGLTLQRGPMRSLIDIARSVNILPGIQEIGKIGGGYRQTQPVGNPFATGEDMSYHEQGLAIDAGWWSERAKLNRLLAGMGWNQFDRSYEPWHYSYGVTG